MCDTWVAMRDATASGQVIFAKNSDRPIFDCQPLLLRPRQHFPAGSSITTEYLKLPQAEVTYAHLGSSPYWCWGYEEGINEWGLVIGNEAIFTKESRAAAQAFRQGHPSDCGLLGMDLIRLSLERCTNARLAVELMGKLVEEYGQFGSGVPGQPHDAGSYDNAYILADPNEAWVFEAVGRRWAARQVTHGCDSISNEPGIRGAWDLGSSDLVEHARARGYWKNSAGVPFDFAAAYIDDQSARQVSHIRAMRSRSLLAERAGQVDAAWMKRIARDHYEDTFLGGPYFDAANPDFLSLCMHVSPANFTWGNTASSCVAVLPQESADLPVGELPVFWWTPGPPCNGCYVPFFPHSSRLPEVVSRAGRLGKSVMPADQAAEDQFDPGSYWWLVRELNDRVKGGAVESLPGRYAEYHPRVRERFDALEQDFAARLPEVVLRARATEDPAGMAGILDAFSADCVRRVMEAISVLMEEIPAPVD